jgi:hypothetical protein
MCCVSRVTQSFLISNFRRVVNVAFILLGYHPASGFYVPTLQLEVLANMNDIAWDKTLNSKSLILPIPSHLLFHKNTHEDGTDRLFRNVCT